LPIPSGTYVRIKPNPNSAGNWIADTSGVASIQYGSNTALGGPIFETFGLGMATPSQSGQTVTIACNAATGTVIGCATLPSAGTVTLSSGAGSHTFGAAYGTAPICVGTDTTAANAVKVTSSTTAVTIAGTTTDVIAWVCTPAAN
jgi:hypothetical protein